MKQTIIDTSYGEVMVKETTEEEYLDCYIGDNFDDYIGTIDGRICDSEDYLADKIEELLS